MSSAGESVVDAAGRVEPAQRASPARVGSDVVANVPLIHQVVVRQLAAGSPGQ